MKNAIIALFVLLGLGSNAESRPTTNPAPDSTAVYQLLPATQNVYWIEKTRFPDVTFIRIQVELDSFLLHLWSGSGDRNGKIIRGDLYDYLHTTKIDFEREALVILHITRASSQQPQFNAPTLDADTLRCSFDLVNRMTVTCDTRNQIYAILVDKALVKGVTLRTKPIYLKR